MQLGAEGAWLSPTSTPQPGSHNVALEDFLAVFPQHLLGGHAEQFFGGPVDAGDAKLRIVQDQSVGKLVENGLQNRWSSASLV